MDIFDAKTFVPQSTKYVFYVALPCLVVNALGININLYDDNHIWDFISAFLILRAIALLIAFLVVVTQGHRHGHHGTGTGKGIGDVAALWLAMTWISTVILGKPIAAAVFGSEMKGAKYGILAAISSFIFQLPFQLFYLECHLLEEEILLGNTNLDPDVESAQTSQSAEVDESPTTGLKLNKEVFDSPAVDKPLPHEEPIDVNNEAEATTQEGTTRITMWLQFAGRRDIWTKILKQALRNPVLEAIGVGFILTLSTIGPTYLKTSSEEFVPGLGWISATLSWIGETVSPIALFTMGVWMYDQGKDIFRLSCTAATLFMVSKLVLVPSIMIGIAKMLNLANEPGRAAVLIAALPISMASFSLANRYGIGETIMLENVALGNLLILPTVMIWNIVLDEAGIFQI